MEDSSGPDVAADRTLWSNLLGSAKLLRERLSSDPKSSCQLRAGCCGADPAFKQSLEVVYAAAELACRWVVVSRFSCGVLAVELSRIAALLCVGSRMERRGLASLS